LPRRTGYLISSTDVWALPRAFPSLQKVEAWLDVNAFAGNQVLSVAAKAAWSRDLLSTVMPRILPLTRFVGRRWGGAAVEVEGQDGRVASCALSGTKNGFLIAVAPAVLAASALAKEAFAHQGLVPADRHVEPEALVGYFEGHGIGLEKMDQRV
jgi:hypothetical protein